MTWCTTASHRSATSNRPTSARTTAGRPSSAHTAGSKAQGGALAPEVVAFEEFVAATGGDAGGWDPEDHAEFVRILKVNGPDRWNDVLSIHNTELPRLTGSRDCSLVREQSNPRQYRMLRFSCAIHHYGHMHLQACGGDYTHAVEVVLERCVGYKKAEIVAHAR